MISNKMDEVTEVFGSNELVDGDESILEYKYEEKAKLKHVKDIVVDKIDDEPSGMTVLDSIEFGTFGVSNPSAAKLILQNSDFCPKLRLTLWHALSCSDYMDLFSSVGAKDSKCIIHAESLIVHICCVTEREGYPLLDFASGPQTLQFIYRIEKFLSSLLKSGGSLNLVFFDVFKEIFSPFDEKSPFFDGYLLLREILLAHVKFNNIPHVRFEDWFTDTSWDDYIIDNEPTCILLEDGSSFLYLYNYVYELLDHPGKQNAKINKDNLELYEDYLLLQEKIERFSHSMRSLILQSLCRNISVAYLFEIGKYSCDFKAFISFPASSNVLPDLLGEVRQLFIVEYGGKSIAEAHTSACPYLPSTSGDKQCEKTSSEGGFVFNSCCGICTPQDGDKEESLVGHEEEFTLEHFIEIKDLYEYKFGVRDLVSCSYLRKLKAMFADPDLSSLDEEMSIHYNTFILSFKILMLHNYLMDTLSLKERATKFIDTKSWEFYNINIASTLDFMSTVAVPILSFIGKDGSEGPLSNLNNYNKDVGDLFDGNLFITILYLLILYAKDHDGIVGVNFIDLPGRAIETFDRVYQFYTTKDASFFPIDLTGFVDLGVYGILEDEELMNVEEVPGIELTALNNPFINSYFKLKNLNVGWKDPKHCELIPFTELSWRDPTSITERMECIDFHLAVDLKEKQMELHKSSYSRRRSLQHHSAFSFLLSKYLGSNNLHHPIVTKLEHKWLDIKLSNLMKLVEADGLKSGRTSLRSDRSTKSDDSRKNPKKDKVKKVSAKVQQLRQKHTESQESKKVDSDTNTFNRLESRLPQLFSNENSFDLICDNILEFTDGPNRQVDLISDFKWVKSVISTKRIQLQFLSRMIECIHGTFTGYRLRILKSRSDRSQFRKMICLVVRLIFITFHEYKALITGNFIALLQTFLYQLGLPNFSRNIFSAWLHCEDGNREEVDETDEPSKGDKKGKKEEKKKTKTSVNSLMKYKIDVEKLEKFDFSIPDSMEAEFQLAYMGDLMERTLGSTVDPRVLFKPDAWQRLLLDVVDNRESALVVAPTSTGKTYICYYAMEQVLRLDDEGLVIYVSPNTALALQVGYEITARFSSKSYGTTSVSAVLNATFLEKFHDPKWNTAQILVTTPVILEKLLIAMRSSENSFVKRIEYIILDEIHCISDQEIGSFLERVLHLSPCPFLALSATVGNPLQFHQWLSHIERTRLGAGDSIVHYISFDERFSDLKLEIYDNKSLTPLNPTLCLSYYNAVTLGFPSDLFLPPKDCYVFFMAIYTVMKDKCDHFNYLVPSFYFNGATLITKRQYRYYLETLKHEVSGQIKNGSIDKDDFNRILLLVRRFNDSLRSNSLYPLIDLDSVLEDPDVIASLAQGASVISRTIPGDLSPLDATSGGGLYSSTLGSTNEVKKGAGQNEVRSQSAISLSDTGKGSGSSVRGNDKSCSLMSSSMTEIKRDYLDPSEFISMLNILEQMKRLPCLVFIFNRNHMDHVLMSVVQLLKRRQWEKYYGTDEAAATTKFINKQRNDRYQMLMRQYETERKLRGASREQKEEQGITGSGAEMMEMPKEPVDVAEDYDPEFNYYNRRIYVNYTDEVESFINLAAASISNRRGADLYVDGLRRGIGIHHEGLPHKFTMLTETLLRLGFLNVIISSKSLAFGINVPCKSVVFAGDNYELTPLMFKQMSGRCGRRGFDLSGHVIFWCLPNKRIKQLLLAKLSNLTGSYATSPTLVLSSLSAFNSLVYAASLRVVTPLNSSRLTSSDARVKSLEIIARSRDAIIEPGILAKRLSSIFLAPLEADVIDFNMQKIKYRMGVEILLELGLIDSHGLVRGCCEFSIMTREVHPSNLFLASIIQQGKIHEILKDATDLPYTFLRTVAQVVYRKPQMGSTLLLRKILTPFVRVGSKLCIPLKSNLDVQGDIVNTFDVAFPDSFPLMPVATGKLKDAIEEYNGKILDIVSNYQTLLKQHDCKLPLTKIDFSHNLNAYSPIQGNPSRPADSNTSRSSDTNVNYENMSEITEQTSQNANFTEGGKHTDSRDVEDEKSAKSWFHANYRRLYVGNVYKSSFVSIGGRGNVKFRSARELWYCSKSETEITLDMIPTIESSEISITKLDGKYNIVKNFKITLDNSYICDYWTHGRFPCVRDGNGLGQYGWSYLKRLITFLHYSEFVCRNYTSHLNKNDLLHEAILQALAKLEPMFNRI